MGECAQAMSILPEPPLLFIFVLHLLSPFGGVVSTATGRVGLLPGAAPFLCFSYQVSCGSTLTESATEVTSVPSVTSVPAVQT